MRKSKIMKALLVFGMSAVTATSMVGIVACDTGTEGENPTHQHSWGAWQADGATGHKRECTAEGHEGDKWESAQHGAANSEGKCPDCGYQITTGGEEENPPITNPENVAVNASDLAVGTLADGTELGKGVKIVGSPAVDENKKSIKFKGESFEIFKRIKLSSKLTNGQTPMGIEINVPKAAKVIAYYYSGSSNNTRGLELYNAEKAVIPNTTTQLSDGSIMATAIFDVSADTTYYIGASVAGVNVYYLAVVYDDLGETWESHEAVNASCGVPGNIKYSVSNYDRYKNGNDEFIMGNAYSIKALEHSYTLKPDSIVIPTETVLGSAVLNCANGHETTIELPVLSSDKYTKTENTLESGKSDYKITINNVEIGFTAITVETAETTYTDIYALNTFTGVTVGSSKVDGENCVYATSGTAAVNTTTGALECGDGTNATAAYVALGTNITSGIVKISGSITVASKNGSWTFLQILNSEDKEFIGFRTGSKGVWGYRMGGTGNPAATPIAAATSTAHTFEILIDLDSQALSIKVDTTVLADSVSIVNHADATVLDLSKIYINCNAGRYVNLNSVTIATQN